MHPLVRWLTLQGYDDLRTVAADARVRVAVHELAHAVSLGLPLWGLNPKLVMDACERAAEPWREEVLARAAEHLVIQRLGTDDRPLEKRIQRAIAVSENAWADYRRGYFAGMTPNSVPPQALPFEESLTMAHQMIESGEAGRIADQVLEFHHRWSEVLAFPGVLPSNDPLIGQLSYEAPIAPRVPTKQP